MFTCLHNLITSMCCLKTADHTPGWAVLHRDVSTSPLDSSTHWAAPCSPTQAQVNYLSSVQLLSWSGKMFQLIRIIISRQQCIVVSWSLGCHPAKVTDSSQTALPQKHLHISGSGPQEPIVSVDIPNLQRDWSSLLGSRLSWNIASQSWHPLGEE